METNIYWLWLLCMGSLIFLMQAGFFLLEGGQVRSRDVTNVMMKMTGHLGLGIIVFLLGVSVQMHTFWKVDDAQMKQIDIINFTKNMALIGALLMFLLLPRPWPMSLGIG